MLDDAKAKSKVIAADAGMNLLFKTQSGLFGVLKADKSSAVYLEQVFRVSINLLVARAVITLLMLLAIDFLGFFGSLVVLATYGVGLWAAYGMRSWLLVLYGLALVLWTAIALFYSLWYIGALLYSLLLSDFFSGLEVVVLVVVAGFTLMMFVWCAVSIGQCFLASWAIKAGYCMMRGDMPPPDFKFNRAHPSYAIHPEGEVYADEEVHPGDEEHYEEEDPSSQHPHPNYHSDSSN